MSGKGNMLSDSVWQNFMQQKRLSVHQQEQFEIYLMFLQEENSKYNLTALEKKEDIINYHFLDSLVLADAVKMKEVRSLADVGSGAGFPGIPLKIMYPHLQITLIEVSEKKQAFLHMLVQKLSLADVDVCGYDWRTFLRKNTAHVDLFCARASLHTDELLRMFSPSCKYQTSCLVYWASKNWQPGEHEKQYNTEIYEYFIGNKERKLVFFSKDHPVFYAKGEL